MSGGRVRIIDVLISPDVTHNEWLYLFSSRSGFDRGRSISVSVGHPVGLIPVRVSYRVSYEGSPPTRVTRNCCFASRVNLFLYAKGACSVQGFCARKLHGFLRDISSPDERLHASRISLTKSLLCCMSESLRVVSSDESLIPSVDWNGDPNVRCSFCDSSSMCSVASGLPRPLGRVVSPSYVRQVVRCHMEHGAPCVGRVFTLQVLPGARGGPRELRISSSS